MTYEPFDVVVVRYPFTDAVKIKSRPAPVLSQNATFGNEVEHTVLAKITSHKNDPWPLDAEIKNQKPSGLTAPSVVRMKLFTLDNRFILRKLGHLSKTDQEDVKQSLSRIFDYL
jgi:mRNA interferase MazF